MAMLLVERERETTSTSHHSAPKLHHQTTIRYDHRTTRRASGLLEPSIATERRIGPVLNASRLAAAD
jgi:hypothetical protein